ncbi:MAG: flagellar hook-basal body complex protein FliE [Spirochaetales bacterium]|nr:flagellar hook-basal body complex protein FliE [Spirochaetales bacterium]
MFLRSDQVSGHIIDLKQTHPLHLGSALKPVKEEGGPEKSFGDVLLAAFNDVNDLQVETTKLSEQMMTDPDSVDVHDVMISVAEANLALSMTKTIVDRALRAYREIVAVR